MPLLVLMGVSPHQSGPEGAGRQSPSRMQFSPLIQPPTQSKAHSAADSPGDIVQHLVDHSYMCPLDVHLFLESWYWKDLRGPLLLYYLFYRVGTRAYVIFPKPFSFWPQSTDRLPMSSQCATGGAVKYAQNSSSSLISRDGVSPLPL